MFIGEYHAQIGEKNRVAIPKKLRDQLEGQTYLTRGYENCLILVDQRRWQDLVQEISKKSLLNLNIRDTKRFILGGASEIEYDSQGRFVVPEPLKIFAKINLDIVFLGLGEWIEVWDEQKWKEKLEDLSGKVSDIADRLSENYSN